MWRSGTASRSRCSSASAHVGIELARCDQGGTTQRHRAGDVLRARTDAELLAAAVDNCFDDLAVADDQGADPLGCADLVSADGEELAANGRHVDRQFAEGLHRVAVQRDTCGRTSCPNVSHRLHHANLVVHPHHRDQGRLFGQHIVERSEVDDPARIHRQDRLATTEALHRMRGGKRCLVFDRGSDDMHRPTSGLCRESGTDDGEIVCFGAARGENHLVRLDAEGLGGLALALLETGAGVPPHPVGRRRVPPGGLEERQHRLEDFRANRGGGGVVEVDGIHGRKSTRITPPRERCEKREARGKKWVPAGRYSRLLLLASRL
jgi:hypothetical protein